MTTTLIILVLWYVIGVAGFIFWWTRKHDLTLTILPLSLGAGILGVLAWIFGAVIHGDKISNDKVIIKRRKK